MYVSISYTCSMFVRIRIVVGRTFETCSVSLKPYFSILVTSLVVCPVNIM
jgi:hypothetical protein